MLSTRCNRHDPANKASKTVRNPFFQALDPAVCYPQTPPESSSDSGEELRPSPLGRTEMGSFVFRWSHPASDVHVTGTFDDWSKSVELEKKDGIFEKKVDLPSADQKIYYKFVVDGNWTTDHTAPQETDESSNINNVLLPEHISKAGAMSGVEGATISGVGPDSTTAQLAGKVPKEPGHEKTTSTASDVPGGFPETPFHDAQEFSVNPIPASSGTGNPVNLKPGEKVPDSARFTTQDATKADTLDKESYEKAGSGITSEGTGGTMGGVFGVPPVGGNMIPESSLPMGAGAPSDTSAGPTIQSAGAGTSTAALAADVPREPRGVAQVVDDNAGTPIAPAVPDVVQESIADSKTAPEAAGNTEAVKEKAAVESELLKDVKPSEATGEPAPATSAAVADTAPAATGTDSQVTTKDAPAETPAVQNATTQAVKENEPDSRDVSPLSPRTTEKPTVTTGVASSKAPETSTPKPSAPESPVSKSSAGGGTPTDKKGRRGSGFFGKLKDKLKHKDK
ncbi:uncharacterized protein KY384_006223 [Bacidia gigantensis]|uniref:uncharacterized protein n=1 Tax=Bacidia gigantensis TaxID=2732470 RepID=UPI001D04D241|nr:uncharacterized protein KY384_006223 [Bacidia gigantensis]KAG8529586.1 hypothetical protein KY384_006223 [Bacidia gigantensis]